MNVWRILIIFLLLDERSLKQLEVRNGMDQTNIGFRVLANLFPRVSLPLSDSSRIARFLPRCCEGHEKNQFSSGREGREEWRVLRRRGGVRNWPFSWCGGFPALATRIEAPSKRSASENAIKPSFVTTLPPFGVWSTRYEWKPNLTSRFFSSRKLCIQILFLSPHCALRA